MTTFLITGASRGIGRELTEQILERGDGVAATLRRPEQLDDLMRQHGDRLWTRRLDVTDTAAIGRVGDGDPRQPEERAHLSDPQTAAVHTIPPDDTGRTLSVVRPDVDQSLRHVGLVGDTYTILLHGKQTAGRFTLIDMHVPQGGGPAPHRHDFEETFHVLEGELETTFRGERSTLRRGETVNIPANAPHAFTNAGERPARLLCVCSPSGQEEFFEKIGVAVSGRTTPPPALSGDEQAAMMKAAQELAPQYRTELLGPPEH